MYLFLNSMYFSFSSILPYLNMQYMYLWRKNKFRNTQNILFMFISSQHSGVIIDHKWFIPKIYFDLFVQQDIAAQNSQSDLKQSFLTNFSDFGLIKCWTIFLEMQEQIFFQQLLSDGSLLVDSELTDKFVECSVTSLSIGYVAFKDSDKAQRIAVSGSQRLRSSTILQFM